jgi:outer membrane immunogenic protein
MRFLIASIVWLGLGSAASANDWTGFYAGIDGGWAKADFDHSFNSGGHYNFDPGDTFDYDDNGGLLGGHVGYNWQVQHLVFGIEAGAAKTWLEANEVESPFFPVADVWSSRVKWLGSVTPRVGFTHDRALVYVKGGWAFGEVEDRVEHIDTDFVSASDTRNGWTIGGGAEFKLTDNIILGAEYNYYDLGDAKIDKESREIPGGGPAGFGTNHDFDVTVHAVTARLSFKFGERQSELAPLK